MDEILDKISEIIIKYDSGEWQSVDNLRLLLRELSANYYYLTKENILFAQEWNKEVYSFKGSDAAGQRYAELTVPHLRKTRKILTATNIVINAIRSEISILRTEQ